MKALTKLVITAAVGVLVAGIALVRAIDQPVALDTTGATVRASVVAGAPAPDALWGRDTLHLQPEHRRSLIAEPLVTPGIPAFSPPLATQRVVPLPPVHAEPPRPPPH